MSWKDEKRKLRAAERERADEEAAAQRSVRWNNLWDVPEEARDQYIVMEDAVGASEARAVLDFITAMLQCAGRSP